MTPAGCGYAGDDDRLLNFDLGFWCNRYAGLFRLTLARACMGMNDFSAGDQAAQRARELLTVTLGDQSEYTIASVRLLKRIQEAWHAVDPAGGHDAQAAVYETELRTIENGAGDNAED